MTSRLSTSCWCVVVFFITNMIIVTSFFKSGTIFQKKSIIVQNIQKTNVHLKLDKKHGTRRKNLINDTIDPFTYAFVGGTVGVMSVAIIIEIFKLQSKNTQDMCPYCMGNGQMLCTSCFAFAKEGQPCSVCDDRGLVVCINCKGDGRTIPLLLQSKATREPDYRADVVTYDAP